jgi:hypothetical protein
MVIATKDTESEVSKQYTLALRNVVYHGVSPLGLLLLISTIHFRAQTKMVYVASLNDQVVPCAFSSSRLNQILALT